MKLIVTTLIVALTASASWFALAQDGEEPRRGGRGQGGPGGGRGDFLQRLPVYKVLDKDANGELSEEEIKNATTALLTLDKNKDGKLSADEIAPSFDRRRLVVAEEMASAHSALADLKPRNLSPTRRRRIQIPDMDFGRASPWWRGSSSEHRGLPRKLGLILHEAAHFPKRGRLTPPPMPR